MKLSVPLSVKILAWFFLNLLGLALVFYFVLRFQFHFGLDSLLAGRSGNRIQAASEVLLYSLRTSAREEWNQILSHFGQSYQVDFFLFHADGRQLAGEPVALPPDLAREVILPRGAPGPRGPAPRPLRGEPDGDPPPAPTRQRRPFQPVESRLQEPGPFRPNSFPKFMRRTARPARYWVGVRLPLPLPDRERGGGTATLLLRSESLRGGGLFFDPAPWLIAGAGVFLFSVLFWFPLVRGITHAIGQMTRVTEQISEGRFDTRVELRRRDELGRLGEAINRMAGRLSDFVGGQKRFLGDIAHELCSPLARSEMALSILEQRSSENQKEYVTDVREEIEHMSALVNELLSFSRASLAGHAVALHPVNLKEAVATAAAREVANEPGLQLDVPPDLNLFGDPDLVKRAIGNLLRNAVRYAGRAGPITLDARAEGNEVVVTVADSGPGVPEDCLQKIFDPFFRVESSRARELGGVGLGLAIVKSCVEACRGQVTCRNRVPSGLEVTLRFKAADQPSGPHS